MTFKPQVRVVDFKIKGIREARTMQFNIGIWVMIQ